MPSAVYSGLKIPDSRCQGTEKQSNSAPNIQSLWGVEVVGGGSGEGREKKEKREGRTPDALNTLEKRSTRSMGKQARRRSMKSDGVDQQLWAFDSMSDLWRW
jgi:hypothetical protein